MCLVFELAELVLGLSVADMILMVLVALGSARLRWVACAVVEDIGLGYDGMHELEVVGNSVVDLYKTILPLVRSQYYLTTSMGIRLLVV